MKIFVLTVAVWISIFFTSLFYLAICSNTSNKNDSKYEIIDVPRMQVVCLSKADSIWCINKEGLVFDGTPTGGK